MGIRDGEFLGRSHYEMFHTSATAGTLAAYAKAANEAEARTLIELTSRLEEIDDMATYALL